MNFFNWISSAVILFLVLGFLLGFWRSWKKSLARFVILAVTLVVSLLVAPAISQVILSKCSDGTSINIFGFSLDFSSFISKYINENIANDLALADGTTNALALSVMNVFVNLILFLILFISISILSLIVYWIVCAILHSKNKYDEKEKKPHGAAWWGLRSVGGVLGFFGTMLITFALLTPMFGVMNICNKFVEEEGGGANAVSIEMKVANASGLNLSSLISGRGRLYHTNDKNIGKVEDYIESYDELKFAYDNSFAGMVFNALGISKLGSLSFNYLSNVEHGKLKINLTDEFISIAKAYNTYKETFVDNEFDIKNNTSINRLIKLCDVIEDSEIVSNYVEDLLPIMCDRWSKDQKFFNMELPVTGEYVPVVKVTLKIFSTKDSARISSNIKTLLNAVKIANSESNKFLEELLTEGFDLISYLETNTTFVKEEIVNLSSTAELRNNMPEIINKLFEFLYSKSVGKTTLFAENVLSASEIAQINWEIEGDRLQKMVNDLAKIVNAFKNEDDNEDVLLGQLSKLGKVIDDARGSALVGLPLQNFVVGYIGSDKVNLKEDVKKSLTDAIVDNWNNPDCNFESLLGTIEKTATFAKNLANGNVNLSEIENVLTDVMNSDTVKNVVSDILEKDVIGQLLGEENKQSADVLSSILEGFVNTEIKVEDIGAELKAAQTIVDIASAVKNNSNEFLSDGDKAMAADEAIENITNSTVVMEVLEKAGNGEEGYVEIRNIINSLNDQSDIKYLQDSINSLDDSDPKTAILKTLFC